MNSADLEHLKRTVNDHIDSMTDAEIVTAAKEINKYRVLPNGLARGIINKCKKCDEYTEDCKCHVYPEPRHMYCPCCGVVFFTKSKTCQSADPHLTELKDMPK